jgi:pyruvate/2-oxoglutarate dehydrogenase complex dihydrolipoamide acyltransferase (E2) component
MGATEVDVRLPDLGDIAFATVVAWLRDAGSRVEEGDDLVEVETEKTTFVVPAPSGGILREVRAAEGARVRVGDVLGIVEKA